MRSLGLGFYLSVAMLPVMIILAIIFVLKKKVNNEETKIYSYILITSIVMTLLEIISAILYRDYLETFAYNLIAKLVLVSYIMVNFLFCNYLMTVCKRPKLRLNILKISSLIVLILTLFTTTKYVETNGSIAPQGLPVVLTFGYAITLGIYQLILAIINRKTITSKKFTPFYLFLVFGAINTLIIYFYPTSFMVGYIWCLTIIVMNFTIENPDVKMLKQVELAKDQAERANRAKSDFLSSMSHEIRTPLNAIVGFSEDIQSHKDTADPEIVEDADYILEASQTLLEIVGNILDINKIESNKMEITEVPYNFRKEIASLAKIDATRIGEKNINFKLNLASDIPYELIGDKTHIKEIINNLLTNAIKYNPNESEYYTMRGIARMRIEDSDGAYTDLTKAIEINKQNGTPKALPYCVRGLVNSMKGNEKAAIEDTTQSIKLQPKNPQAFHYRGLSKMSLALKISSMQTMDSGIQDLNYAKEQCLQEGDSTEYQNVLESYKRALIAKQVLERELNKNKGK